MNEQFAAIQRALDEIGGVLRSMSEAPATLPAPTQTQGIEQAATSAPSRTVMNQSDIWAVRDTLRKKEEGQLHAMFAMQAFKRDQGIPLEAWIAMGGGPRAAAFDRAYNSGEFSPEVKHLLDTTGGAALIRQDLEPILYEMFIRDFPGFDRFAKEPANGLVHTWQRQLTYGEAQFMGELGTVTDDTSTYERATTNVAIIATRRGVSLKNQFAALQSGSGFNPQNLELRSGLTAISKKMQDTIYGGQATDSGGTANNELGLYDANGFTGLRAILNTGDSYVENVDPATSPDTTGSIRRAVANAVVSILNAGPGRPVSIHANPLDIETFNQQQEAKQRWVGQATGINPGIDTAGVITAMGALPFLPIRGSSISSYTSSEYSGNTVRDLYVLDESMFTLPYLGSEGPTTIEIPMGVGGQLTRLFIFFGMWGFADKASLLSNKVRVKV